MYKVIVLPPVSRRLGEVIRNRSTLLRVLNRLYDQLENHASNYRGFRDPQNSDLYTDSRYSDGLWRIFEFSVNDARATGYLFVEEVVLTT